jgi:hypothetical protein|tara:strand:- start:359 stop:781 length:423 start_codon:yes stop_codon:yes gene_type:complete
MGMSASQFIKLFETVGIPVLTAAAAGYALWWLIRWLTGNFKQELNDQHTDIVKSIDSLKEELDEETRDTRDRLGQKLDDIRTMVIRLIDRVRVLEINFIEHDETVRAAYGLSRAARKKPRHEVVEELKEQIKDAGKTNGD